MLRMINKIKKKTVSDSCSVLCYSPENKNKQKKTLNNNNNNNNSFSPYHMRIK